MKKTTWIFLTSATQIFTLFSTAGAFAQATTAATTKKSPFSADASSEQIVTHQAAVERHSGIAFSLGVSTISPIATVTIAAGTNISSTVGGGGALTSIFQFTPVDAVQLLFGVPSTQGGLNFGVGGLYKRTLFGNESAGFHAGAGLGLGTVAFGNNTNFAMSIPGLVGVHYTISGTQVAFHFDGGAAFTLVSIAAVNGIGGSTTTNLSVAPYSGVLGASVVYLF